jgi:translocation and assembly module TamB
LAVRGVGGIATGVVAVEGLHRDARLDADLRISKPQLGVVCFESGWLRARADGQHVAASASLESPGSQVAATVRARNHWGAALAPEVDTSQPIDASLDADNFRAAALLPLLRGPVNQLDGRIDANVRIHVDPDFKSGTMDGAVRLTNGVVEVPALGERLHDVTATASIRPWGTLRFDGITASGSSGMLKASAKALLDGLRLRTATADVEIPSDRAMPLTVEGVSLGEASGRFRVEAQMPPEAHERRLDISVSVEQFEMRLPHSTAHAVQSLEPAPRVVVGMYQPDGQFVVLPLHPPQKPREPGSMTVRVAVNLARDVRVRRDANLDVELTGQPVLEVTDAPRMNGTINVIRGYVDVFGKRFAIDPASTISFTGDSSNPQLVVTAQYDAPDGTRIYADAVGPLKKPKINLRSEPVRTQDEILGLLIFGSQEGLAGAPPPDQQPDPTQRAAGLASGPLTEALNKALSGITSLDVTTRLDTSQAANPRPELELRVSSDVLARVTVQTGMPAPGEPPDRTLLTIDWRFKPRWSLESTVGDEGSTFVDLLWHHRY